MTQFQLPHEIVPLLMARDELKRRYASSELNFTLDGNLVGDIGEAVAAELFDIKLSKKCGRAIDGFTRGPDPRSVQVKASGTFRGPAFRKSELGADYLLFFHFDFDRRMGEVVFNGPERVALSLMPKTWIAGQRMISVARLRKANLEVPVGDRLTMLTTV